MSEKKQTAADEAPVKSKKGSQGTNDANNGFCAYIGPTIIGVIQNGTIYNGTRNEVIKSLATVIKKYPLVQTLIVQGDALPTDRIKVNQPGNILYVNYHKLEKGKK